MGFDNSFHLISLSNRKLCYVSAIHIKLIICKAHFKFENVFLALSLFDWLITKKINKNVLKLWRLPNVAIFTPNKETYKSLY
jgi:hypothetical protein